jgi:hypothetical protein
MLLSDPLLFEPFGQPQQLPDIMSLPHQLPVQIREGSSNSISSRLRSKYTQLIASVLATTHPMTCCQDPLPLPPPPSLLLRLRLHGCERQPDASGY